MLKLQIKDSARSAWLVPPKLTVGQDKSNELVIPEKGVADFHLEVAVDGQDLSIGKVQEGESCLVNGRVVTPGYKIGQGDIIEIGPVKLEVVDPSIGSTAATGSAMQAAKKPVPEQKASGWVLQGDHGSIRNKRYPIDGTMTLGRAPECDLPFSFDRLSRKHAQLKEQDGMLTVKDLDSSNGTYVNDKRVTQSRLRAGDVVRFDALGFIVVGPKEVGSSGIEANPVEDMSKTVVRSAIDIDMINKAAEEAKAAKAKKAKAAPQKKQNVTATQNAVSSDSGSSMGMIVTVGIVVIAGIAAAAWFFLGAK